MEHDLAVQNGLAQKYLLGELDAGERDEFEAHYFECVTCAQDVRDGAAFVANARAVFRDQETGAAPVRARPWDWRSWFRMPNLVPSAVAAALAMVVIYQSAVVVPGLRRATEPQLIAMNTLQPATRGEQQVVRIDPSNRFFSLTFDVNSRDRFESFEGTVTRPDGSVVAQARSRGGNAGSLNLWLPSDRFEPGEYILTLRGISGNQRTDIERFKFVVQKS